MTPERKLDLLLGAAEQKSPDYVFMAELSQRLARRQAWLGVWAAAPWTLVAALVLWALGAALAPQAEQATEVLAQSSGPMGAGAAVIVLSLLLVRRFGVR